MDITLSRLRVLVIAVSMMCQSEGKSTQKYSLPGTDCNKMFSGLDGADVSGKGIAGFTDSCDINLSTGSSDPWMFYAKDMSLMNCQVYIELFTRNSTHPVHRYRCARPDPGIITVNSTFIKLRLHHNNKTNYHFNIVFSARKPKMSCEDFVCDNGYCISRDLQCDDVDNCFDLSDESENSSSACYEYDPFPGENFSVLVAVVGGSIVFGISAFCCRMWKQRRRRLHDEDLYEIASGPFAYRYGHPRSQIKPKRAKHKTRFDDVDVEPEF